MVLVLNLLLVAMLLAVGLSAHSLSVFAEGADFLADAAAIGISLLAIWLSKRPPTPERPGGYPRATAFAALVNGGWLLVLSLLVIAGAIERLVNSTSEVHGLPVLVVSGVAAAVMLAGALVLGGDVGDLEGGDANGDLNMRTVLLDTAADAAAATGVAVTGGEQKESLEETLESIRGRVAAGTYRDHRFQVLALEGELALVELHRQVIDNILGKRSPEDFLLYTRDPAEAVRWVDEGAGSAAFFLDAPDLHVVLKLAQEGNTLPQKSTYFHPKPPSGMVFLRLDPNRSL